MVNFNLSNENGPCGLNRRQWIIGGGLTLITIITIIIIIAVVSNNNNNNNKRTGRSILDDVPLVDGYNNLAQLLRKCAENNLQLISFDTNLTTHPDWNQKCKTFTDLVRMQQGKLWAQVWFASAPCSIQYKDGVAQVLEQIDVLKRLHLEYSDRMQLVTSISDLKNVYSNKKISSFIGIDSGHLIDSRLALLRIFYDLGVRFLTLSSCTNKDVTPWLINNRTKLTPFGEDIIREANRLGMVLDLTGIPTKVVTQITKLSIAPVILSHVASKSLHAHDTNVDDNVLQDIATKKGLVMITFDKNMLTKNDTPTLTHLFEHFDKIASVVGIQSIGLGSGFGLYEQSINGMNDTSMYPELFDGLYEYKSKYKYENKAIDWHSFDHLKQVAYQNFERILIEVEKIRDSKLNEAPYYKWIPTTDLDAVGKDHKEIETCRTN